MKLWETIVEAKLRSEISISEPPYGFCAGKWTTDILLLWEGQKELYLVFVDLDNRILRKYVFFCMRTSAVVEKHSQVQNMLENPKTLLF